MATVFLLFETAAGYVLNEVMNWEQIGHDAVLEEMVMNAEQFSEIVKFKAMQPFDTAAIALENMQSIVEGQVTDLLYSFLSLNLPKSNYSLAVVEPTLGKNLSNRGFSVIYDSNILELVRGCRMYQMDNIAKLAFGPTGFDITSFQVGLGHSYTRNKLQIDPNRNDKPIVNCVATLDSSTKSSNTYSMRVREWYGCHFPELCKIVTEQKPFCQMVQLIRDKNAFDFSNRMNEIIEIVKDEEVAQNIKKAANMSIGQELTEEDMQMICDLAGHVILMHDMKDHQEVYLSQKLSKTAPNLSLVAGDYVSARLISHAGSLVNVAKLPSSTIQILGAEKALFRALKTRTNTPKYGILYQSTIVGKATKKHKGKAARYLANKCAIAARIDCFSDNSSNEMGQQMLDQLHQRMVHLEAGLGK
ncbi:bifunctional Nucleolar protein Nop56-Nop58/Nop domain superfamily/Nop [Babesia duncani]|uniref:Nucleolar protein 56 n=1 Tax=Babesia duncani TaxID=323732 RepID=A0AAD9UN81_9APIC|nr:bifunctional Nucleolar protein Nop56-Nop58/Nop domain superfamily/Nop [Babesia duncani]